MYSCVCVYGRAKIKGESGRAEKNVREILARRALRAVVYSFLLRLRYFFLLYFFDARWIMYDMRRAVLYSAIGGRYTHCERCSKCSI